MSNYQEEWKKIQAQLMQRGQQSAAQSGQKTKASGMATAGVNGATTAAATIGRNLISAPQPRNDFERWQQSYAMSQQPTIPNTAPDRRVLGAAQSGVYGALLGNAVQQQKSAGAYDTEIAPTTGQDKEKQERIKYLKNYIAELENQKATWMDTPEGQSQLANYQARGGDEMHSKAFHDAVKGDQDKFIDTINAEYDRMITQARKELEELDPKVKEAQWDFFQTPKAFKNGYDFGDITKTILGTTADVGMGLVKGAAQTVEGVLDLGVHAVGWGADALGFDKTADFLHQQASVNQVAGSFASPDKFLDGYSALGKTMDAVTEGVGQVCANIATGGIGKAAGWGSKASALLTYGIMGASSMGSGMSEAYSNGATDGEAFMYGLIAGAADITTEMIFGGIGKGVNMLGFGKGLSSADDMIAKKVASVFNNQLTKNLVEFCIKSSAEGLEGALAGGLQALGKKLTYMSEKDLSDILADENLFEQFIVEALTSGISQSGGLNRANKTGTDFITGFNQNEQAVIQREVENRIAEEQKDGTKLTARQIAEIKARVEQDIEKGYISTDTIEEVLGGDGYKTYKDTSAKLESLQSEYDALYQNNEKSDAQIARQAELKKQIDGIKATFNDKQAQAQIRNQVYGLVKGGRLAESYYEGARRKQAYQADLSKYDKKQQAIIKAAIDSGVLNNTNRTHDFVDMIAKVSAEKGVSFSFTNNQKLKESGFALNGKTINGYVTKDGITLNINSAKSLNKVVGHEIAHVLEGTEFYNEVRQAIYDYAQTKGEWKQRYDSIKALYKDVADADIKAELTADLIGDYLFTDPDFIKNLSVNHRNVFQKMYDEIKYLCSVATAGSKELRQLEKAKKAFAEAYRANSKAQKNTAQDGGTKYSITEAFTDTEGNHYDNAVLLDTDFFDGISPRNWGENLRTMVNERSRTDPFILPITDENGNTTLLQFAKTNDRVVKDGASNHRVLDKLSSSSDNISKLAVVHIDEIVSISEENLPYYTTENNHQWLDQNGWLHRNANVINKKNGNIYNITVDIAKSADGRTILYATDGKIKKVGNVQVNSLKIKGSGQNPNSADNVAQENPVVKTQYSISDSDGNQLTKEQTAANTNPTADPDIRYSLSEDSRGREIPAETQERLQYSVIRDESGRIKPMYHGSPNGNITSFNAGTYFTENKEYADRYQNTGASSISTGKVAANPKTYEVYLDIRKPFDLNDAEARNIYINEYIKGGNAIGINPYLSDAEYAKIKSIDWTEGEDLRDFLIDNGYDYDGLVLDEGADGGYGDEVKYRGTSYMIFDAKQVVNVEDPGNRFYLSESAEEYKFSLSNVGETQKSTGKYNVYGKDIALPSALEDISPPPRAETAKSEHNVPIMEDAPLKGAAPSIETVGAPMWEDIAQTKADADDINKSHVSLEDYANQKSPIWRNVEYSDDAAKARIMQQMHDNMIVEGAVVTVADTVINDTEQAFPDLRSMKKKDRNPILKSAMTKLKNDLRQFLNGFKNQSFEFEVNGKVLDATLYNTGINEVLEKVTKDKASMLYSTEEIFRNARYLYSTPDYDGDPNVYRWNYFYTPVQIGGETVGVRIAVRDMVRGTDGATSESQIYSWGIKKDASLGGGSHDPKVASSDASSDASNNSIDERGENVNGKKRKWVETSTESKVVDGKVLPKDLDQDLIHYHPISNKKTLGNANARLGNMGYENAVAYMNGQFANNKVTLDDIALGERLIQEAVKRGDTKTAGDLIMDISILGTELGQKVQALSIIKRLTPEGQLRMLQRTVERGKTKGDKAFNGVKITQDMIDYILKTYGKDGTYDQDELNKRVEDVKQQIADQMSVSAMDYINEWRYLSMLGNPKTHIRNIVSNIAMRGTVAVKNAIARTIEDIAPAKDRTKTWKSASEDVKAYAKQATTEMYAGETENKYSEGGSIKAKRQIFKTKAVNWMANANSKALSAEDTFFSKPMFESALRDYLTANGISTKADIEKNPKIVAKAKQYAMQQAKEVTFQQDSYIASKINEIERKSPLYNMAVGAVLPFKKTPINIAKTAASYSPLGFARNIYDAAQVRKGNMEVTEAIDHLAQSLTGTSLTLIGYALASMGFLNGAGEDDKEGKYDYQLGEQSYSFNFNGHTFSLSWLSPVAMPLFVGANAYEQLVEGKEWNADVVAETLAQTLDPLSEMSFLSSLDDVLSSYDSGVEKFMGIFESMGQSYISQFVPTLSSQIASAFDDTKRSTKASADSDFKFGEETVKQLMYKIPGLRNLLESSTDIWGNEIKQSENVLTWAFESFLAPYARRENIATAVDEEIKYLYRQTGDTGLIPSIPNNYVSYNGEKYKMSAAEHTDFKKTYGQTAFDLMERLFNTETYRNADPETKADMVNRVYDYASDLARKEYFAREGVEFTNATKDGKEVYKEDPIKGAIEADLPVDEYVFSIDYPEKYSFFRNNGISYSDYAAADEDMKRTYTWAYENPEKFTLSQAVTSDLLAYRKYTDDLSDIRADYDRNGKVISGTAKAKKKDYIFSLPGLDDGQKAILYRSLYDSAADKAQYNWYIVDYLNNREDITYTEMITILKELGFTIGADGVTVSW